MNAQLDLLSPNEVCTQCDGTKLLIEGFSDNRYAHAKMCKCFVHPCPICGGTGFTIQKDYSKREVAFPCSYCKLISQKIRLYNNARIPKRYYYSRLNYQESDEWNEQCFLILKSLIRNFKKKYNENPDNSNSDSSMEKEGLLLMGPAGTGKTFLMAGLAYQCTVNLGISCLFQEFKDLLGELRDGYSSGKSEVDIIRPHTQADVLIIDDLGKGRNTEWELQILDTLITERYNSHKPLMITTNFTENEDTTLKEKILTKEKSEEERFISDTLLKRVGPRIYSRLKEMCSFLELGGPDRRLFGDTHHTDVVATLEDNLVETGENSVVTTGEENFVPQKEEEPYPPFYEEIPAYQILDANGEEEPF